MTGYSFQSYSSRSMASPRKSSRRPWKNALSVETSSYLPKRRGRDRKHSVLA